MTPASIYNDLSSDVKNSYTIYGFIKTDLTQPAFMLPGIKSYATTIKFNPYLFKRQSQVDNPDNPAIIELPYRMVFAVGTTDQVLIYSTESIYPIAVIGNVHYASINDMAWETNRKLVVASSDGYCSVISFEEGESNIIG